MMSERPFNILSIQSHVAFGHVGNSAAVFPMQRLGCEVWPVHTVQFSNHPGYGAFEGQVFAADMIRACIAGIAARGALTRCDAVLSGYMGSVQTGEAILEAVAKVRAANPSVLYCCDPVIGDTGTGLYVRAGVPELMRERALPAADILTPNQFELEYLADFGTARFSELVRALETLRAKGPRIILVTSVAIEETPNDAVDVVVSDGGDRWRVRTPKIPGSFNGAGDALAALFLVHWLHGRSPAEALSRAVSSIHGVLRRTAAAGEREIAIVAAQQELVLPSIVFRAEPLDGQTA